jgi:hypothetical protein
MNFKERCKFTDYEYLVSIPGLGPTIAAMILVAIGDSNCFENSRRLLKLVGLDLAVSPFAGANTDIGTF